MLRKGKQPVTISMQGRKQIPPRTKSLCAQTINLADAVEDDEEEDFLRANPTIVPVFEVDVEGIIEKDEDQGEGDVQILPGQDISRSKVLQMMDQNLEVPQKEQIDQEEKEARIMAEKIYEKKFGTFTRVREDEVKEFNLGTEEDSGWSESAFMLRVNF
ncbi:hypothetical protein L7F22_032405 [Adiantum nelumboides]|nr:hypothetical protein [Adiantum nelumboides]